MRGQSTILAVCLASSVGCGGSSVNPYPLFTPASGPAGTLVTITGKDFSATQSATIGGVASLIISQATNPLTTLVMPGASSGGVSVTTSAGSFSCPGTFTVTPAGFPTVQEGAEIIASSAAGSAEQGYSVALSANGTTALIGGPADSASVGAAWVYVRNGSTWTLQAKLVGSGSVGASLQGFGVALSADGSTAIVGGPGDNTSGGAAWVFVRSGGAWTQQGQKLFGAGAVGTTDEQGTGVALSADGNTAVIGGSGDSTNFGAAWVFARSAGAWTQQSGKLIGTGGVASPLQGYAVALSADGNTALVSGGGDSSSVGAVWVYTRNGTTWTQQGAKLLATGEAGAASFGGHLALSADGNTAAIGGPADNGQVGATWIFARSAGTWTQQGSKLVGSGAAGASQQGDFGLALSADGNTALIGGLGDNSSVGAAWVFTRSGGAWAQQGTKLVGTASTGAAEQGYGIALSADGNTALIGAPFDNANVGGFWVFVP